MHQLIRDNMDRRENLDSQKFSEHFTELNNGQKDTITVRRLMNNLNKTEVGKRNCFIHF